MFYPREDFDIDSFLAPHLKEEGSFELDFESSPSPSRDSDETVFNSPSHCSPKQQGHYSGNANNFAQEFLGVPKGNYGASSLLEAMGLEEMFRGDESMDDWSGKKRLRKKRKLENGGVASGYQKLTKSQKKSYIAALERQVKELSADNNILHGTVTSLTSDNHKLKNDVLFLQGIITKEPQLASLYGNVDSSSVIDVKQNISPITSRDAHNMKSGLVLMMVFLSFGLFMSTMDVSLKNVRKDMVAQLPISMKEEKLLQQQLNPFDTQSSKKHVAIEREKISAKIVPKRSTSSGILISESHSKFSPLAPAPEPLAFSCPLITDWKPNTTYLICSNVSQISPPSNIQITPQPDAPMRINFMIPPECLNSPFDTNNNQQILEVTCQVLDVNVLPLQVYTQDKAHHKQPQGPMSKSFV